MADVPNVQAALRVLKAAAHPIRLEIVREVSRRGSIRTRDVTRISEGKLRGGTPGYHLSRLVKTGLLVRVARGEYAATRASHLVNELTTFAGDPYGDPPGVDVPSFDIETLDLEDSVLVEVMSQRGEPVASIVCALSRGEAKRAALRVTKLGDR